MFIDIYTYIYIYVHGIWIYMFMNKIHAYICKYKQGFKHAQCFKHEAHLLKSASTRK